MKLLHVLTTPCTVCTARSMYPLLLLLCTGLCSIVVLIVPFAPRSLAQTSTNATNAGSLSLFTMISQYSWPNSLAHAISRLAAHSFPPFFGTTVDIILLVHLSFPTKIASDFSSCSLPMNM